jgi:hypothetical protein
MSSRLRISLVVLLVGMLASVPMFAGSAVVGSVAGSLNASVGGQVLLPNTTVFSGDSLQVKEGAAVVALDKGNRVALGKDTVAQFLRNDNAVTVVLTAGNVSLFHPDSQTAVRVQVGNVTVEPERGFKTLGEVAMENGTIVVTAKDGTLQVKDGGRTMEVAKGKTIALVPKTARAPQTGGSQKLGGTPPVDYAILAAAGVGAGFGIAAFIKAKDADSDALSASSNAAAAESAATAAGSSAVSAVSAADANTTNVGCALNDIANSIYLAPSPYTPPSGVACPANPIPPI